MQLNYYHDLTHKYDFLFLYQLLTVVGCIFFRILGFFSVGRSDSYFGKARRGGFFGGIFLGSSRGGKGGEGGKVGFFEDLDSEAVFCGRREVLVGEGEREIMV